MAQTLVFDGSGQSFLAESLHLLRHDVPSPGFGQVLVKMLAAPINPLDLLVLQNKYPVKPHNSEQGQQIPGYDGAGRVIRCDESVTEFVTGDHVIVKRHGLDASKAKNLLKKHGSDIVLEESELAAANELEGKNIMLGLDAVFGAGGMKLVEKLSMGATYVSYGFLGGMSPGKSIHISQELFFQRNITFKGFRFSAALSTLTDAEQMSLYLWISDMLNEGELTMPFLDQTKWDTESVDGQPLRQAVRKAQEAGVGQRKTIFVFS